MKNLAPAILLFAALSGCAGSSALEPPKSRPVVLDPVCGRVVDPSTPWKAVHRDVVYSFHSEDCRGRFAADPDLFAFGSVQDQGPRVVGNRSYYTDPVCGLETPPTRWSSEYGGRVYYFHNEDCALEFRFHPQAYAQTASRLEAR